MATKSIYESCSAGTFHDIRSEQVVFRATQDWRCARKREESESPTVSPAALETSGTARLASSVQVYAMFEPLTEIIAYTLIFNRYIQIDCSLLHHRQNPKSLLVPFSALVATHVRSYDRYT